MFGSKFFDLASVFLSLFSILPLTAARIVVAVLASMMSAQGHYFSMIAYEFSLCCEGNPELGSSKFGLVESVHCSVLCAAWAPQDPMAPQDPTPLTLLFALAYGCRKFGTLTHACTSRIQFVLTI